MSTRNKHDFEINAKISTKFEGAFTKPKKRKKATKEQKEQRWKTKSVVPIKEHHFERTDSPPGEENEQLSKQDDDSGSDDGSNSSDIELPGDDVPELFSGSDEEADTKEMQNAAMWAMQGSFLPIMAIMCS